MNPIEEVNTNNEVNANKQQMGYVLQELMDKERICWFCDEFIEGKRKVKYIMFKRFVFCCCPDSRCASDGEDLIRERQYV